jgi:hypothetical protein
MLYEPATTRVMHAASTGCSAEPFAELIEKELTHSSQTWIPDSGDRSFDLCVVTLLQFLRFR